MVYCKYCSKHVPGTRPNDGGLHCDLCGNILEDFNFSTEVTFVKNAAGQSQACGNIVRSVQSGISSSRERRIRMARDEFMNLKDALGIGDDRDDVVDMAVRFYTMAVEQNFTSGRRTDLVQASCLYLTCREKDVPYLLIDFSSYLRVSVYELGSVYLQLCEMLYIAEDKNYEKLVDPSIFIPRFSSSLLKGKQDKAIVRKARDIIASMKRDWIQTGRKPSGICGAALYTAALSHESGNLTVDELLERERERERDLHETSFTKKSTSDKETVLCMHKGCKPFSYGQCEDCYKNFVNVSGGVVGGSDPPAFQRAEKERMDKAARGENEEGIGTLNEDEELYAIFVKTTKSAREPNNSGANKSEKQCSEKGEENIDGAEENADKPDESGEGSDVEDLSDIDDDEVNCYIHNEEEKRYKKIVWEEMNREYLEEQAAKEAALKEAEALYGDSSNCPEYAKKLYEAAKAATAQSRKEKQQKKAEEAKNMGPPATAAEAVQRTLVKKKLTASINLDVLDELFDTSSPAEKAAKRLRTETDMENNKKEMKSNEDENGEFENEAVEDDEGNVESYDMNTDLHNGEKLYEKEEEEDGYDFESY